LWLKREQELGDSISGLVQVFEEPLQKLCFSSDPSTRLDAVNCFTLCLQQVGLFVALDLPWLIVSSL
jgi:hypothetical protein